MLEDPHAVTALIEALIERTSTQATGQEAAR
jgi:hypothetical protein